MVCAFKARPIQADAWGLHKRLENIVHNSCTGLASGCGACGGGDTVVAVGANVGLNDGPALAGLFLRVAMATSMGLVWGCCRLPHHLRVPVTLTGLVAVS